ncbi:hypothetical protein HK097_004126 [Rhizophlyctis rosea]|uniref:Uncharacterized protein n=1 Tax=Rhizophlyctis rosea TaxID=64517 RepID=A0AAD5S1X8_9FUNG|nr:hypothetical protein HK097_004126 [Rhizophlyctis rosea]
MSPWSGELQMGDMDNIEDQPVTQPDSQPVPDSSSSEEQSPSVSSLNKDNPPQTPPPQPTSPAPSKTDSELSLQFPTPISEGGPSSKRLSLGSIRGWGRKRDSGIASSASTGATIVRHGTPPVVEMFVEDGELEEMLQDAKSDEDDGGPVILLNGSAAASGRSGDDTRRSQKSGNITDSLSLQSMTNRFASAVIPEEAVVDADQVVLTTKIEELATLRKDLSSLITSLSSEEDSVRTRKASEILKKVDAEIALYEQFLDSNGLWKRHRYRLGRTVGLTTVCSAEGDTGKHPQRIQ